MSNLSDPILREAAGLGAVAEAAIAAPPLQAPPTFTFEFESCVDPALDGPVVMRYATVGDTIKIEGLLGPSSGVFAEAVASISVLIEKAPASWYRKDAGQPVPSLDLSRMIDPEAISDLYYAYNRWRSLFRTERARAKTHQPGQVGVEGGEGPRA